MRTLIIDDSKAMRKVPGRTMSMSTMNIDVDEAKDAESSATRFEWAASACEGDGI